MFVAMTEKYTTQSQCMRDSRTGYFHGCMITVV